MKKYRIPAAEWRRKFYDSKSGIPTVSEITASIDKGELPGRKLAGKYVVYCDGEYEPLWNEVIQTPAPAPAKVTNPIALRVLQAASN